MQSKMLFTLFTAFVAISSAMPTINEAENLGLETRATCGKKEKWQGGGCETDWANNCFDRCYRLGHPKGCCMESIDADITSQHCFPGWNTCECSCMTN